MSRTLRLLLGCVSVAAGLLAQHLSYGVAIGTALTNDFNARDSPSNPLFFGEDIRTGDRSVIVGPVLQWNFTPRFAVEADGLFRELHFNSLQVGSGNSNPTITWEFPIFAKFDFTALHTGPTRLRPFLEAGPSFRTTGNLNATPSHFGVSAGAGLQINWRNIGFAPTLRYIRWQQDPPARASSRADQLELLLAITNHSDNGDLPHLARLSFGAVLGVNFLDDYSSQSHVFLDGSSTSSGPGGHSFLIGPDLQFRISRNWSVEAGALYRPMKLQVMNTSFINGQLFSYSAGQSATTWQFPVLAQYHLSLPFVAKAFKSFLLAGPSFRAGNSASRYGITPVSVFQRSYLAFRSRPRCATRAGRRFSTTLSSPTNPIFW